MLLGYESLRLAPASWSQSYDARNAALLTLQRNPRLLAVLNASATAVALSRDGRLLATGGADGDVTVWDVVRRVRLAAWHVPDTVVQLAFSGDGRRLAAASTSIDVDAGASMSIQRLYDTDPPRPGAVFLWDLQAPRAPAIRLAKLDQPAGLAFGRGDRTLAASGHELLLWDVTSRRLLTPPGGLVLTPPSVGLGFPYRLAFSRDGRMVAGVNDQGVAVVDVGHPRVARFHAWVLGSDNAVPEAAAFSRTGLSLTVATADGALAEWNPRRDKPLRQKHVAARGTPLIAPDARTIAWVGDSGVAVVTDMSSVLRLLGPLGGHANTLSAGAFSGDGKRLAIAGDDGTVTVYDLARPVGLGVVLAHHDNETRVSGSATAVTATLLPGMSRIAASRDGRLLAAASETGRMWIFGGRHGTRIAGPLQFGDVGPRAFALSPNGAALAVLQVDSSGKSPLRLFGLARGVPAGRPHVFKGDFDDVAFGPDGRTVEVIDANGKLRRLPPAGGAATAGWRIPGYLANTTWAYFSPDGRTLAVVHVVSGELSLWDAVRGRRLVRGFSTMPPGERVNAVAFSQAGDLIAVGGDRGTVSLWDVEGHRSGAPLTGQAVDSMAFSPDGRLLVTGSQGGTLQLIDVAQHRLLGEPIGGLGSRDYPDVYGVAVDAGDRIATADGAGNLILWSPLLTRRDPQAFRRRVCSIVPQNLTREEWRRYLPGEPYRKSCPALP